MGKLGTPMRSAYAASKHALHGFFDCLRAEVYDDNVKVTIICPGYVQTNVSINALTGDGSKNNSMNKTTAAGLTPEDFANKALTAIARQREEIYIGKKEILGIYIKRFFQSLSIKLFGRGAFLNNVSPLITTLLFTKHILDFYDFNTATIRYFGILLSIVPSVDYFCSI
jgi:short-subunit dehydrogenase